MNQISEHVYCFEDTCRVYVLVMGERAVLIDFGAGGVLDELAGIGVRQVSAVLMTHHHRDQGQGLARAAQAGIDIWVPHAEQDLFHSVSAHWQARETMNNYNMRQDRFALLDDVPVAGTLLDYETLNFGGIPFTVVPTPGHTLGSVSLMAEIDGLRLAFTGDLIAAPGQLWSLAATQWTYNGQEGAPSSIASLLDLKDRRPDKLLPSHGAVMDDPAAAIDPLVDRLWQLLKLRGENRRLFELRERPYEPITPHLLRHRASVANTYVVLSESGKALLIDFGYDFMTGFSSGYDRASRRPWLYTIPALKRQFGVSRIDVALPTHFHDDHVAGFNLLRRVEGTQVWAADFFADILEHPHDYDLPCLWYDPIAVDRTLPVGTPFEWEEYTFTLHPLPGHTRYAVAIEFTVDGKCILATGDQYQGDDGLLFNYVYPNRFDARDYERSAALYARLQPEIILTGHWNPLHTTPDYFGLLATAGSELARLHEELLDRPVDAGDEDFIARITPYQPTLRRGERLRLRVEIRNPLYESAEVLVRLVLPEGWQAAEAEATVALQPGEIGFAEFDVQPPAAPVRRARIAADVTVHGRAFGQQAEALVTIE